MTEIDLASVTDRGAKSHVERIYYRSSAVDNALDILSFWKTPLDILGEAPTGYKIKYLRVGRDMSAKKRDLTLLDFQNKSMWRVLLKTLSTGAAGINGLTVANRVHLLEPQWNPAVENQAIETVLRLDQQRKVTITCYAVKKTIEDMVESRQHRNLQLAVGGFSGKEEKQEAKGKQWQQLQDHLDDNHAATA